MPAQGEPAAKAERDIFERRVVDVREVFREPLVRHLADGRITDKEKLEQEKLKITAGLVNFTVSGGILLFRQGAPEPRGESHAEEELRAENVMDEVSLFKLLRGTIQIMLGELNKPDVNLLKVSLSKHFRGKLQQIFTEQTAVTPDRFPVKIFHDVHSGSDSYLGINMRNTRSLGDDIDRIERDAQLRRELVSSARPCRHSDGNLLKMFAPA